MNHQPYETWIFDTNELTENQEIELRKHLAECGDCRKTHAAWHAVEHRLATAPMAAPQPGFAKRWKEGLELRHRREAMHQARRLFSIFTMLALVLLATASGIYFSTHTIAEFMVGNTETIVRFTGEIRSFVTTFFNIVDVIPMPILAILCIVVASWIVITCSAWLATVWHFNKQGVISK